MYDKRFVKDSFLYSFSIGTSYLIYHELDNSLFNPSSINRENLFGIPIEFTMHWFDSKKEKIKVLGLFPVGKPTGFGMSSGFKFYGTIAKKILHRSRINFWFWIF